MCVGVEQRVMVVIISVQMAVGWVVKRVTSEWIEVRMNECGSGSKVKVVAGQSWKENNNGVTKKRRKAKWKWEGKKYKERRSGSLLSPENIVMPPLSFPPPFSVEGFP